jgi:membrane protease subunit (stomatin/prohibitin family)
VSTQLEALSLALKQALTAEVAEYGVALTQFNIHSINVPEDDPAVKTLKAALAKRAEMGIVGFTYQQERSYDVMQTAAGNEGSAGTLMGAGMGVGMGMVMAPAVGQAYGQMASQVQLAPAPAPAASQSSSSTEAANSGRGIGAAERIRLLKELATLRTEGILTDAEFDEEKRRILASQ